MPFACFRIGVFERADLEHVRIVPTLAQCGVAEDEPGRFAEAQQAFLVLEDEFVRADVVAFVRAAIALGIAGMAVLVVAEVAVVHVLAPCGAQPVHVAVAVVHAPFEEPVEIGRAHV